ncbi:MFS transporter [Christensenella sp. MSJ-20]|uniref:MFS transporter n=1 Tax=Christensenella sp. MSJ-20 TaxID=2841518 RepID=UPI001C787BC0|nr:MFS transporter [Christensenella sp. MSJ-20]
MEQKQSLYRYAVLAGSFFLMAVPFSIVNTIHSLFIVPVTEAMGISTGTFSLLFTIGSLTVAATSPFIGKLLDRVNVKLIMGAGALFTGLGFLGYGYAVALWQIYLLSAVIALGLTALTTIPISTLLTDWFPEKRGTAMGFAFSGAGTGTFLWMQMVSRMLSGRGYRYSYITLGIIILAVSLPIAILLMKRRRGNLTNSKLMPDRKGVRSIFQDQTFFRFSLGLLLLGLTIAGTQIHIQPYLSASGYPLSYNANVGSALAAFALMGSLVGGFLFDKLKSAKSVLILGGLAIISYVLLMVFHIPYVPFLFAGVYGLCLCMPSLLPSYGVGELYGQEAYAQRLGMVNLVFTLGGAGGPLLSGVLADNLGYSAVWIVYLILAAAYLFLFQRAFEGNAGKTAS